MHTTYTGADGAVDATENETTTYDSQGRLLVT